jgi:hypothetical protein
MSPPPSGSKISQERNQRESRWKPKKKSGEQSNQLAKISDYIGNKREVEDRKSLPVGSPVGQNEPPVPIGSQTQRSEPTGDKNRKTSHLLSRSFLAWLILRA